MDVSRWRVTPDAACEGRRYWIDVGIQVLPLIGVAAGLGVLGVLLIGEQRTLLAPAPI